MLELTVETPEGPVFNHLRKEIFNKTGSVKEPLLIGCHPTERKFLLLVKEKAY